MDVIIRNARLADGRVLDIALQDGVIAKLEADLEVQTRTDIDAKQKLVLPAFVNGQLHACKVFWRRQLDQPVPADAAARFALARTVKAGYRTEEVLARVDEVMRLALLNGTCAIRLFADVDEACGLTALRALLQIKARYEALMIVQVVAFPQDGVLAGNTEALMHEALDLGADVVGGIPWIEADEDAQRAHTDMCFALAQAFDKDLHLVCDDTSDPASKTLEYLAQQTIARGYQGRVAATQCAALAFYDDHYASQVIAQVKAAGITVFANSQVSLVTTSRQHEPYARGITRIHELRSAGVPVACAQDDIDNWYYPFGRNDMLEVAQFMSHVGGFAWDTDKVLPMVTAVPAKALGLSRYGLAAGNRADLVMLDASSWHEALALQPARSQVFLNGRCVATTTREAQLHLEP